MVDDNYQTVKEVADRLLVCEATVRLWIKSRDLRAIEIGKGWRVSDSDLNAFLHKHATCEQDQNASFVATTDKNEPT